MGFGLRLAVVAFAMTSAGFVNLPAWAGDDGQAPLWQGIGSIFGPVIGFGDWRGQDAADRLPGAREDRRAAENGLAASRLLGVRRSGLARESGGSAQEGAKGGREEDDCWGGRRASALHASRSPRTTPVTVRAVDPEGNEVKCTGPCGSTSSVLGNLNPLNWVGMGKSAVPLGPEPDREWLTDPPKGFRAPVEPYSKDGAGIGLELRPSLRRRRARYGDSGSEIRSAVELKLGDQEERTLS